MSRRTAPMGLPSRPAPMRRRSSAEVLRAAYSSSPERPLVSQRSVNDLRSSNRHDHRQQPPPPLPSKSTGNSSYAQDLGKSLTSQRSMSNLKLSSGQSRHQRMPSLPTTPRVATRHFPSRSDVASISSAGSSNVPSLFDRNSHASSSSGTSAENSPVYDKPTRKDHSENRSAAAERRRHNFSRDEPPRRQDSHQQNDPEPPSSWTRHIWARNAQPAQQEEPRPEQPTEEGYYEHDVVNSYLNDDTSKPTADDLTVGSALWGRVAAAASYLTINVNKAWEANIRGHVDGNETPPGAESRLTLAMKAFHIQQAKNPQDLPDWLFEPHERQVRSSGSNPKQGTEEATSSRRDQSTNPDVARESGARPRGLRDVYANAVASYPTAATTRSAPNSMYGDSQESKVTNRLRAARDAKRAALTGTGRPVTDYQETDENQSFGSEVDPSSSRRVPTTPSGRRVGLPAGPGPGRTRYSSATRF